jgi:hypothetical protein
MIANLMLDIQVLASAKTHKKIIFAMGNALLKMNQEKNHALIYAI